MTRSRQNREKLNLDEIWERKNLALVAEGNAMREGKGESPGITEVASKAGAGPLADFLEMALAAWGREAEKALRLEAPGLGLGAEMKLPKGGAGPA